MKPHVTEAKIRLMAVLDTTDESKGRTTAEILEDVIRTMAEVSGEQPESIYAAARMESWTERDASVLGVLTIRQAHAAATPGAITLEKLTEPTLHTGSARFVSAVEHLRLTAQRQTGPSGEWRPHAFPTIAAAALRALAALNRVDPAVCEVTLVQESTPHLETVEVSPAPLGDGIRLEEILAWEQSEVTRWQS